MPKPVRTIFMTIVILVGFSLLFMAGFLGFLTMTEFSPEGKSNPEINGKGKPMDPSRREFTFFTWNIGYSGLGQEMDFFYEGGTLVRPEKEQCSRYFEGIKRMVQANDTADFIFLQEVDVHSKRSWYCDEFAALSNILPDYFNVFAQNYGSMFIPIPLPNPMGRVKAGLACYLKMKQESAEVRYYKTDLSWPKRLAFLKRCFVLLRFGLDNGKDLVVLNTHNSAYDSSGVWRKIELSALDSAMKSEYMRGNYVIAGGDWNINPRGFNSSTVASGDAVISLDRLIEPSFLPGWQFVFDPNQPSNRNLDMPYKKGVTKTTIIDFFVLSPNVEVRCVSTIPTGFACSDHQPVVMGVRLK